ncbi:hypothetical protein NQ317_008944 [Molorchus minor]|uniref:Uncharacterized protein n=1 Tax=Molorchus minor TaxID=1323400 RepID=A0ABQ9K0D4_9CUCU|nr:hypothetical protein NQ317_008944 [Molorchus minor]
MRHETLVRHLNKQGVFNELYRNLFPKYIEDLNMYLPCNRLLQYYPKKYQFNLFSQTFTEVINEDIYSNISCLEDYFFKVIDDLTVRQTFAQRKFEENPKCDDYIVYYKPEECFNIIRNRIKLTTEIQERKRLLQLLIEACTINGIDFLEKVLKYFCERHQNDDKDIRYKILEEIDSKVELDQLKEIHWKYINKMFTIQKLHKENSPGLLLLTYIKFLYKNNKSEMEKRDATMELIKQQIDCGLWVLHDVASLKDPQIEKNILLDIIECLPGILKTVGKESEINFLQSKICVEIFNYNSRYPKQKIDILNNEALIEIVRRNLQEEYVSHQFQRNLVQLICKSNRNDIENEILNFYFEKTLTQFPVYKPLRWYLKYDPLVLVKNVHNVVKALPKVTRKRWFKFKQYSHLNLDKMIIGNCLKQLDDKDESDKTNLICPLSYMCNAEDYIRIMRERNIIPITPKLAIEDEEAKKMYPLQQEFARQFKNTEDPQNSLQILIDEFCQGDYLKVSLPSLYSIFHKSPENILKPYVKKIFENTAMSVKKHSLFLSYAVFDFSAVLEMLRKFENTNNDSLHKHVFAGLLNFYKKFLIFISLLTYKISGNLENHLKKNAIPAGTNRFDALSALGLVDKKAINTEVNLEFVCKFFGHWMAVFSAFETFEEFVLLSLLQLEKEADQNQELYAKKIVLFSEEVVSDFGKFNFFKVCRNSVNPATPRERRVQAHLELAELVEILARLLVMRKSDTQLAFCCSGSRD